jgi:hypothetical protein
MSPTKDTSDDALSVIDLNELDTIIQLKGLTKKKVRTSQLANGISRTPQVGSGILPPVMRFISSDFRRFIVERPPFFATISVKKDKAYNKTKPEEYTLAMPWTVYGIRFGSTVDMKDKSKWAASLHLWFRPTQIFTEEDKLYVPLLPNSYQGGDVCQWTMSTGHTEDMNDTNINVGTIVNTIIASYWSSIFNFDITSNFQEKYIPQPLRSSTSFYGTSAMAISVLDKWAELDMPEVLDLEWTPVSDSYIGCRTVGDVMKSYQTHPEEVYTHIKMDPVSSLFTKNAR